ncbi:DUF488 domain-containing protein [Aurantimonas sp. A2-1-M11]|uniref:DUF488 domain-containing protein n=1 Tax=Aurantimonas sp. A2-1-M11 TaxID=3113712 RepID=UPI002F9553F8
MAAQFTSIGHSNRDLGDVIDMLREARIALVIDVRTFPRSRNNPVYNIDSFPDDLAQLQIRYRHSPGLGGRRSKQPGIDESLNAMWRLRSFHNYADYALGDEFGAAFDELVSLGRAQRIAMMCSEAVWWRCHRRIITDYLLLNGHAVDHLMAPGRIDLATPTPGAQKTAEGKIVYPAPATES